MTPTISDLLAYASQQARIEARDYFTPATPALMRSAPGAMIAATATATAAACIRTFPGRIRSDAPLIPGSYGGARRLDITADAIDYTACQYAAREIWPAVFDYFNQTNAL
jgi:hypothetical protein